MTKKEIGRSIAFILVVCLVLILLCDLFELRNNSNYDKRFTTYRNLNEDTIDAVWIGTSGTDRYWIPAKAYDEYGMTVSLLTSDAMPSWLYINMVEEVYTYQNPELIIVDLRAYAQSNVKAATMEVRARRILDAMDFFSVNRIKTAFTTMEVIHSTFEEEPSFDLSYLLPFIKYHTKWEDDYTFELNLGNKEHAYAGFFMSSSDSVKAVEQEPVVYDLDYYEELDPVAEASLYEFLEYINENDLNVLFVDTPKFKSEQEIGRANTVYKILDEYEADYINFCMTDEEGNFTYIPDLDSKTDFYNEGHVNYYGAEKFTEVFSAYLDENFDLPDRRNDENVDEDWAGIYAKILKKIASWEKKAKE